MEGASITACKGLRSYWQRRGYVRLNGWGGRRRKSRIDLADLGGSSGGSRKRRFWRFKIRPKVLLFKTGSIRKFLARLRDAYVKAMLGIANARVFASGYGGSTGEVSGFRSAPIKEYDEKMLVEIYKSLILAQGHLVRREAGKLATGNR